jgi:hypothetical protein
MPLRAPRTSRGRRVLTGHPLNGPRPVRGPKFVFVGKSEHREGEEDLGPGTLT